MLCALRAHFLVVTTASVFVHMRSGEGTSFHPDQVTTLACHFPLLWYLSSPDTFEVVLSYTTIRWYAFCCSAFCLLLFTTTPLPLLLSFPFG